MADTITEIRTEDSACFDPECPGTAESESDGELTWYNCNLCGSEFGYVKLPSPQISEGVGACQLGVPEPLRKLMSAGMEGAMADAAKASGDTPVTLGRKPGS